MPADKTSWIILDRDGVINHDSDSYIKSPDEWHLIEGSGRAIAKLNQSGFQIAVITNQSGVARNYYSVETLNRINEKMHLEVEADGGKISHIYYCPHGPNDQCVCRKPSVGLFLQFAKEQQINLKGVYAIGDSIRDLQAAVDVGCTPALVKTGKGPRSLEAISQLEDGHWLKQVRVYEDLLDFANVVSANN